MLNRARAHTAENCPVFGKIQMGFHTSARFDSAAMRAIDLSDSYRVKVEPHNDKRVLRDAFVIDHFLRTYNPIGRGPPKIWQRLRPTSMMFSVLGLLICSDRPDTQ